MEENQQQSAAIPSPLEAANEIEKVFSKFDANGDGKISSSELETVLNGLCSATTSEEVAHMMLEMDADGDGYIDLGEFKTFHRRGGEDDDRELKEAFDVYDKDRNGKISAAELQSVLRNLGEKCSVRDCGRMIGSFDVDGDGCINFEEFKKMMAGAS